MISSVGLPRFAPASSNGILFFAPALVRRSLIGCSLVAKNTGPTSVRSPRYSDSGSGISPPHQRVGMLVIPSAGHTLTAEPGVFGGALTVIVYAPLNSSPLSPTEP